MPLITEAVEQCLRKHGFPYAIVASVDEGIIEEFGDKSALHHPSITCNSFDNIDQMRVEYAVVEAHPHRNLSATGNTQRMVYVPKPGIVVGLFRDDDRPGHELHRWGQAVAAELEACFEVEGESPPRTSEDATDKKGTQTAGPSAARKSRPKPKASTKRKAKSKSTTKKRKK